MVCWLMIFVMVFICWASFCSGSLSSAIIVLQLIFFGMFFEVWAYIYYMLYAFYCCKAPSALGIFVHIFVIVFCFYHSASNCKYAGTFVPSEGVLIKCSSSSTSSVHVDLNDNLSLISVLVEP